MKLIMLPILLMGVLPVEATPRFEVVRHPTKVEYVRIINNSVHFHTCSIDSAEGYYYLNLWPTSKSSWYPASLVFKYKCRSRIKKHV